LFLQNIALSNSVCFYAVPVQDVNYSTYGQIIKMGNIFMNQGSRYDGSTGTVYMYFIFKHLLILICIIEVFI
jgi:hypothetical protein